ncbi:MAG: Rieske (2Fe-2S) protein, partial [Paracoccaceae bacterium]
MNCIGVGFSDTLSNARVMRAFVNGKDVVVWRSTSGKLSAWENRCPHRGMRLSHGFVRG